VASEANIAFEGVEGCGPACQRLMPQAMAGRLHGWLEYNIQHSNQIHRPKRAQLFSLGKASVRKKQCWRSWLTTKIRQKAKNSVKFILIYA